MEGTSWTGAWSEFILDYLCAQGAHGDASMASLAWTSSGNSQVFGAIHDPNNNVAIGKDISLFGNASAQ